MRPQLAQHRARRAPAAGATSSAPAAAPRAASRSIAEHVVVRFERPELVAVLDVRTEAAEVRQDRLAVVRVAADLARQREQLQRLVERDRRFRHAAGQRRALGLLRRLVRLVRRLAELHVGAEPAVQHVHVLAGLRDRRRGRAALPPWRFSSSSAASTVRSAGGKSSGMRRGVPGPPSPRCTNGPYRPMRTRTGAPGLGIVAELDHADSRMSLRRAARSPSRPAHACRRRDRSCG